MPFFRKKPVQIEARLLTADTHHDITRWLAEHGVGTTYLFKPPLWEVSGLIIPTLESPHEASYGDWIIKGIAGEFYPCKPEIFAETYEEVIDNG